MSASFLASRSLVFLALTVGLPIACTASSDDSKDSPGSPDASIPRNGSNADSSDAGGSGDSTTGSSGDGDHDSGSQTDGGSDSSPPDAGTTPPMTPVPTGPSGSWQLVFEDNFNGSSLDPSYWKTSWYSGVNKVSLSAANVAVSGGSLGLTLSSSTVGAAAVTGPVTDKFGFKVGTPCVWEARILFPGDGKNFYNWPAFWVLDDSGDGPTVEIDIAEVWDGVMQTNYHASGDKGHDYGYYGGAYHTWTMYRTTTNDYFYIDGELLWTMPVNAKDTGLPQYVLFNIGVQGSHQQIPSTMFVDYVRAWVPTVGGGSVVNPKGGFPG